MQLIWICKYKEVHCIYPSTSVSNPWSAPQSIVVLKFMLEHHTEPHTWVGFCSASCFHFSDFCWGNGGGCCCSCCCCCGGAITLSIMTLLNNIQHNNIQHNDTQHKGIFTTLSINDNQQNNTLPICCVSHFVNCCAECRYAECHYPECHYAVCHGAPVASDTVTANLRELD